MSTPVDRLMDDRITDLLDDWCDAASARFPVRAFVCRRLATRPVTRAMLVRALARHA